MLLYTDGRNPLSENICELSVASCAIARGDYIKAMCRAYKIGTVVAHTAYLEHKEAVAVSQGGANAVVWHVHFILYVQNADSLVVTSNREQIRKELTVGPYLRAEVV